LFFEKYFDFKCIDVKGDHKLAVLKGTDDFTLVLMSESFNRNGHHGYPDALHIGFLVDNILQVNNLYARLKESDIALEHEPGNMRGVFGFYFHAPGNILTEVSCPMN
jgi:catechol 2,3-dioxygenase-like lactoylglutathione lyase family enzyme